MRKYLKLDLEVESINKKKEQLMINQQNLNPDLTVGCGKRQSLPKKKVSQIIQDQAVNWEKNLNQEMVKLCKTRIMSETKDLADQRVGPKIKQKMRMKRIFRNWKISFIKQN